MDYTLTHTSKDLTCSDCFRAAGASHVRRYAGTPGLYCPRCNGRLVNASHKTRKPTIALCNGAKKVNRKHKLPAAVTMPDHIKVVVTFR